MNKNDKETLIHLCGMTCSCIRDYESLLRQYKECMYNEEDLFKPNDLKMNLLYRQHFDFLKMISQRVIFIEKGVYIYLYKESIVVVIGSHDNEGNIYNKIIKYIKNYKKITSNISPCVIWCGLHTYIENIVNVMNKCIEQCEKNIHHDVFILGNIMNYDKLFHKKIRNKMLIALIEEKPNKKKYTMLDGYGYDINTSVLFDYVTTITNRIYNVDEIRLYENRKKAI